MKLFSSGEYNGSDLCRSDLRDPTEETERLILITDSSFLKPEDLAEAKFVLCLAQHDLERCNRKYKKNRPFVQEALLANSLRRFAVVLEKYYCAEDGWPLWGLWQGLEDMGIIDDQLKTIL